MDARQSLRAIPVSHVSPRWRRRARNFTILVTISFALLVFVALLKQNLHSGSFSTGYLLLASLGFLAAYNLRKKISFVPGLGSSQTWMQLHIYVGFATIAIFVMHIGWRVPNGHFERWLAALYLFVTSSGIYGLYITRSVPAKLAAIRREVIFEQIPVHRWRLANQARELANDSPGSSDVIARFYVNHLVKFFEGRRSIRYLVSPSARCSKELVAAILQLDRFLSTSQKETSRKLASLVKHKEDLDYHYAMQGRLKIWLFAHIGATYGLLIASLLHATMAHAFSGGLR